MPSLIKTLMEIFIVINFTLSVFSEDRRKAIWDPSKIMNGRMVRVVGGWKVVIISEEGLKLKGWASIFWPNFRDNILKYLYKKWLIDPKNSPWLMTTLGRV